MKTYCFEEATAVVNTVNSIVALRNFEHSTNRKKYLFIWFYDILILCTITGSMLYFNEYNIRNLPNNMERITYKLLSIVYMGGYVWTLTLGWYHSKGISMVKERICNVDEYFKRLRPVIHYRDLYRRVTATGVLFAFSAIIMSGLYIKWLFRQKMGWLCLLAIVSSLFSEHLASIVLYDFLIHVYWLELSFMETNDLLRTFLVDDRQIKAKELHENAIKPTRNRRRQFLGSSKVYLSEFCFQRSTVFPSDSASSLKHESQTVKQIHFLQEIRRVHLKLCKIAKMVNRVFDTQLMVQSSVVLIYLTVLLYFAYNELGTLSNDVWQTVSRLAAHLVDLLSNIGKFSLASYSCENTVKQANKIREIINKLSIREFNTEMKDEIRQFSLQISLSQIGSSKSNFFRLNYDFLRGCISFVITYLIVIIQWSSSLESENAELNKNRTYNQDSTFL